MATAAISAPNAPVKEIVIELASVEPVGMAIPGQPGVAGITTYLSGRDGQPLLRDLTECWRGTVSPRHYHTCKEFHLMLSGALQFPDHRQETGYVHYVDAFTPYGPFTMEGFCRMLIFRPEDTPIVMLDEEGNDSIAAQDNVVPITRGRDVNPKGRQFGGFEGDAKWEPVPGQPMARRKLVLNGGPQVEIFDCSPGMELALGPAPHGRFELLAKGSAFLKGKRYSADTVRYTQGPEPADRFVASPYGASFWVLSFDGQG